MLLLSPSLLARLLIAWAVVACGSVSSANPPSAISADEFRAVVADHCHRCHGGEKTKGKVDLAAVRETEDLLQNAELMETVIAVLHDGEMPPEEEPPLAEGQRDQLIGYLQGLLDTSLAVEPYEPTPIRRLNRFQYNNAVVDLLELTRDVFWMPERMMRRRSDYFNPREGKMPDTVRVQNRPLGKDHDGERPEGFKNVAAFPQDRRAEHGFDNRADHLTLSPLLMEQFLQLSHSIVESKDLNAEECRAWDRFFTPPIEGEPIAVIRERLTKFLRRAFRRPVEREILDRFVAFADKELKNGASFTDAMKSLVGAAIASPDFLYLYSVEEDPRGEGRQRIDDFELASRLSFFLWISIPDDALLDLAEAGKLSEVGTLAAQIDRMLVDPRASRFCDVFPGQWLQLDRLVSSIPHPEKYPYFYYLGYRASMHMMMEPLLLFETVYVEDRSIIELLDPKFTWQSDHLRTAYEGGQPRDQSTQTLTYKREPVDDPRRGGVITNAAVMTMTSTPDRTLPITRGAWLNSVIFNDPPEPPPADVPPLPEADEEALSKLTIRERFVEHRKREDCRGCHRQIDPMGFALENYGPTGIWRQQYENGRKVDASGQLFGKYPFASVVDFKEILLQEKRRFMRGFSAHLLSFALGRELGPADSPALDKIADRALDGQDSLRSIMKMVAMSDPFLHKNTRYEAARQEEPHLND